MEKIKTSVVLEGGGMRGAFTAGALSWLIDHNIEPDNAYGISSGAVHLCSYLKKSKKDLEEFSTIWINSDGVVGIKPFLKCGRIVDYYYMFEDLLPKQLSFTLDGVRDCKTDGYIGIYELEQGKTVYHSLREVDMKELQAACTLPLIGKLVEYHGRHMMDGGITDMIPIEQAIKDGCNRNLVISTKPATYVRKPAMGIVVESMRINYPKWPSVADDYKVRHLNFAKQINEIKEEEEKGQAVYIYPTKESNVTRLGGSREELQELYDLGYADMEARKEEIFKLFGIDA